MSPYASAPLYACESSPAPWRLFTTINGTSLPAPLPGYALLPFVALALVPFPVAAIVWFVVLLASCAIAWRALASLIDGDLAAVVCACALSVGLVSIPFGELVPVAVAALCACAVALRDARYGLAVTWAAIAMIEPHIALPVLLALVGWERTRLRAIVAIVVLALLHAVVDGASALPYFAQVLPAHALAEVPRSSQYSIAWIARGLGVPIGTALGLGTASYAIALGGGIAMGGWLALRLRAVELLALVPAAFALFGGPFIHQAQMLVAIPAALVLVHYARGRTRFILGAALILIALPWIAALHALDIALTVALFAGIIACVTLGVDLIASLRITLVSVAFVASIAAWHALAPPVTPPLPVPYIDPQLAQASWAAWIYGHDSDAAPITWVAKMPTWIGLCGFVLGSILLAREQDVAPVAPSDAPMRVA